MIFHADSVSLSLDGLSIYKRVHTRTTLKKREVLPAVPYLQLFAKKFDSFRILLVGVSLLFHLLIGAASSSLTVLSKEDSLNVLSSLKALGFLDTASLSGARPPYLTDSCFI